MSEIDVGKELVQALINRISWLESVQTFLKQDLKQAEARYKRAEHEYNVERKLRLEREEKLDAALDKLYAFIGVPRDDY